MKHLHVLYIGDPTHPEFRAVAHWLEDHTEFSSVGSLDGAQRHLSGQLRDTQVIVLAEARPGQYQAGQIDELRRLAPLARVLGVLGSWCEGEMRSGSPLPGVLRAFWHQWPGRFARELTAFVEGRCPSWGHPVTMTMDEHVLQLRQGFQHQGQGLDDQTLGSLQDACRQVGYATVSAAGEELPRVTGAAVILFDVRQLGEVQVRRLHEIHRHYTPTPMVALLAYPRHDIAERVRAAGVSGIVSKPFFLDDLYWEMDRVARRTRVDSGSAAA